jgi:broad specificity phosphatase PhoE
MLPSGHPGQFATVQPMTTMLLTRHGQSEWNAVGRWQGQADPPLSDLGRAQARSAADRIGSVDVVVASDLDRAVHTAAIISEVLGVGPVIIEPGLRERDAGEWSGLTRAEIERDWPGYLHDHRRPPGFEADEHLLERTLAGLDRIHRAYAGAEVLVVTHGGVVYALEARSGHAFERLPNLGSRWLVHHGDRVELGERLLLVDEAPHTPTGPAAEATAAALGSQSAAGAAVIDLDAEDDDAERI